MFILPPWEAIHQTDNERYESFEQLLEIHEFLKTWYFHFGYDLIEVKHGAVKERMAFILNSI